MAVYIWFTAVYIDYMTQTQTAPKQTNRIANLTPGSTVKLMFHGNGSNETYIEDNRFLELRGDERNGLRAVFAGSTSDGTYEWEAYKYDGRWVFGSSAQRLSIVEVVS